MTYTENNNGFEFTRSSEVHLAAILLVEILLFGGVVYCVIAIKEPFNYFAAFVLMLFFVLIALAVAPAYKAYKNGHKILIWGANSNGLLLPALQSSFTEYIPPQVILWSSISKAIFTKKLVDRSISFEKSTSLNVLVVELESKKIILLSYTQELEQNLFLFFNLPEHCHARTHVTEELEIH